MNRPRKTAPEEEKKKKKKKGKKGGGDLYVLHDREKVEKDPLSNLLCRDQTPKRGRCTADRKKKGASPLGMLARAGPSVCSPAHVGEGRKKEEEKKPSSARSSRKRRGKKKKTGVVRGLLGGKGRQEKKKEGPPGPARKKKDPNLLRS